MIESLRIENLVVVEAAELEFGPGLNVLTGETGAGKSIVLGALSLLVGARAGSGTLREGAEQGSVEALFRTDALGDLERELADRDLLQPGAAEAESHELVVRRTLSASGRSRARVGGQLVPVTTLADLFSGRVEVSSQHSSQALLRPESHGWLLDAAGGLLSEREAVAGAYHAIAAIDEELGRLRAESEARSRRQDFLAFQLAELEEVGLAPGELGELDAEHGRLAHCEQLRAEGGGALAALRGEDGAGAVDLIAAAARAVSGMAKLDSGASPLADRLRDAEAELGDVSADLERYVDRIEGDPERLMRLDERIGQVEKLRRKYGQSEDEIFAFRDGLAEELAASEGADSRIGELEKRRTALHAELAAAAVRLTRGRTKAGRDLARKVQKGLRELAMPDARFEIALEPAANRTGLPEGVVSGPRGAESPEFRFSANRGESPRSLQKVASGGELSRVFLAVKNALRQAGANMVLVFDEVDAGIGGRAAECVGRALAELAERHQVLCITHLPQIAAFADVHFHVAKSERKGRTRVQVVRIEGDERVEEIARMAGGEEITAATRRHARDLMRVKSPT
ncbi:MAG: DNA repair protein RecN [Deltaproteobacteria bacterium]|nr:DNA repair protein RecN [Deltaproteobacteria bacterium]